MKYKDAEVDYFSSVERLKELREKIENEYIPHASCMEEIDIYHRILWEINYLIKNMSNGKKSSLQDK